MRQIILICLLLAIASPSLANSLTVGLLQERDGLETSQTAHMSLAAQLLDLSLVGKVVAGSLPGQDQLSLSVGGLGFVATYLYGESAPKDYESLLDISLDRMLAGGNLIARYTQGELLQASGQSRLELEWSTTF